MSGGMIANFRGARALLLMPDDANRAALAATLTRLGVIVSAEGPFDVAFYDADEGSGLMELPADAPSVAVVGSEAPSRLLRVARHGSLSHVMKPIRGPGVFAALVLAFSGHAARRRAEAERLALDVRLKGRRDVMKAVLRLMRERDLDDDAAYAALRVESMRRRMTVEAFAAEIAAAPAIAALIRLEDPPVRKIPTTLNRR
jgi:AmiR/NasT family two-component response regulator